MLVAFIILVVAVAALGQFALYYWRAVLAGVAAEPISERLTTAVGLAPASLRASDFRTFLDLHSVAPGLKDDQGGLRLVRAYYEVLENLRKFTAAKMPALAAWSDREMLTCTRYVAVLVDQRLEANLACAAEARSL